MTTTTRAIADRLFDALIDRQDGAFQALKAANERRFRFSRSVIEGARQGANDLVDLGRKWVQRPTDVLGLYEVTAEAFGNAQARSLALLQEWLENVAESQREGREVLRRGFGEMREAAEQVRANAPSFLRRTAAAVRRNDAEPVAEPVSEE